jgi:hypothetical protein
MIITKKEIERILEEGLEEDEEDTEAEVEKLMLKNQTKNNGTKKISHQMMINKMIKIKKNHSNKHKICKIN